MVNRSSRVRKLLSECKRALEVYYGAQFRGLVLFGSMARNQAIPSSDIDLLVLLERPFDYFREIRQIIDLLYPIQLDSEQLISAKPTPVEEFEKGSTLLYRNAQKEGIRL